MRSRYPAARRNEPRTIMNRARLQQRFYYSTNKQILAKRSCSFGSSVYLVISH